MQFSPPLIHGTLIRRYKRFLADIRLDCGTVIVAHCANPGSMLGLQARDAEVWLSANTNPKAKLDWRWQLIRVDGHLVSVNTGHPNDIAAEAIAAGQIPELSGYQSHRREVPYGQNSRIDFLLEGDDRAPCYLEIKCVTLRRPGEAHPNAAEFPDAVTKRGTKHLVELRAMAAAGCRAMMLYLVLRGDCDHFRVAADIDPAYAKALASAQAHGVEAVCYACQVTQDAIVLGSKLPIVAPKESEI
jgi:sugar fermentation stimulation protein A